MKIRITDLEKEFGLQGRTIRQVLRKAGLKAPETGIEGFGPRARYEWTEDSEELEKVRSILKEFVASKGKRTSRTKQEVEEEVEELVVELEDKDDDEDEEEDSEDDEEDEED